jgi:hypothetical protein
MLALAAAGVAALELLLLVVLGSAVLVNPGERGARAKVVAPATKAQKEKAAKAKAGTAKKQTTRTVAVRRPGPAPAAELPRKRVAVMVLNGNGVTGAAAAAAHRVSRRGYRIGTVGNATSSDFTRSLVMYRRGFEGEAVRLARDLGISLVGPLDGLRARDRHGAHAVLVVGS